MSSMVFMNYAPGSEYLNFEISYLLWLSRVQVYLQFSRSLDYCHSLVDFVSLLVTTLRPSHTPHIFVATRFLSLVIEDEVPIPDYNSRGLGHWHRCSSRCRARQQRQLVFCQWTPECFSTTFRTLNFPPTYNRSEAPRRW